ncbi:MAG: heme ABC transporter ATP-binding protein [Alphaproteobacteria bacterium]|nr:heme ABC transporter ATP-binding protein [Alphaproteobacteria bacterium]
MGLRADRVTVRRGGRALVENVSLRPEAGELHVLAGANGAGKSTLLGALAGTVRPDEGEVTLDGRPLSAWSARALARRRAVLGQRETLSEGLSAREVVALGRYAHGGLSPRAALVDACLRETGVAALADRAVPTLSGGERQRVHLARALAQVSGADPGAVLLLDEPTSALDLAAQVHVLGLLASLARDRGLAVVCVLHDLNLAGAWADRITLLRGGCRVAEGPPGDVLVPDVLQEALGVRVHVLPHPISGRPQVLLG